MCVCVFVSREDIINQSLPSSFVTTFTSFLHLQHCSASAGQPTFFKPSITLICNRSKKSKVVKDCKATLINDWDNEMKEVLNVTQVQGVH